MECEWLKSIACRRQLPGDWSRAEGLDDSHDAATAEDRDSHSKETSRMPCSAVPRVSGTRCPR
jgi:hypothetical protein